jgi:hypothetical protein
MIRVLSIVLWSVGAILAVLLSAAFVQGVIVFYNAYLYKEAGSPEYYSVAVVFVCITVGVGVILLGLRGWLPGTRRRRE